jgi:hypothetical protein
VFTAAARTAAVNSRILSALWSPWPATPAFAGTPGGGRPGPAARAAARTRHPSARTPRPDRTRLLERLAERFRTGGARWPRVAAAMVVLRGISGDDVTTFARRVGISAGALVRLESGGLPITAVPPLLREVRGLVDWAWVEAYDRGGLPPPDP